MMRVAGAGLIAQPWLLPAVGAFGLVALGENARYPVDNPATHLELTMVHEAMVLEYSGPYLALLELASSLKLTTFALLFCNFLLPARACASRECGVDVDGGAGDRGDQARSRDGRARPARVDDRQVAVLTGWQNTSSARCSLV